MIYFDNAATSFPKPLSVLREITKCIKSYCGNPGRGAHSLSRVSSEKVYTAREEIASLFGSDKPENVFFTYNDTYALNMVIKGLLQKGDHVLISDMEHNSVYRPIAVMAEKGLIEFDIFDSMCLSWGQNGEGICEGIKKLIKPNTKMLIAAHASNICSAVLPICEIGALCRSLGIIFVLDGAQSAGHIPISMERDNIDVLCAPGHKGLYGLQGSGFVILGDGIMPNPIIEGGSGVNSLDIHMPELSPERFEAGTVSVPCAIALCEGIKFVRERGMEEIHEHECTLFCRAFDMLSSFENVTIYAPMHIGSVLLFNVDSVPSERLSAMLDGCGICTRGGYHCSPLGHRTLGTPAGGAVRLSFSPFNTMRELETFYSSMKSIVRA